MRWRQVCLLLQIYLSQFSFQHVKILAFLLDQKGFPLLRIHTYTSFVFLVKFYRRWVHEIKIEKLIELHWHDVATRKKRRKKIIESCSSARRHIVASCVEGIEMQFSACIKDIQSKPPNTQRCSEHMKFIVNSEQIKPTSIGRKKFLKNFYFEAASISTLNAWFDSIHPFSIFFLNLPFLQRFKSTMHCIGKWKQVN